MPEKFFDPIQEKQNYSKNLDELIDDWLDGAPDVSTGIPQGDYKARPHWLGAITHTIEFGVSRGYLPEIFRTEIIQIIRNYHTAHPKDGSEGEPVLTSDEIKIGNDFLKKVKEYIENK